MAEMFVSADAYENMMGRWSARLAPKFAAFARVRDRGRVLDVGCGTGAMVQAVAGMARQSEIVGIDPAPPFIERCQATYREPRFSFRTGDAQELPFPDRSFDQCVSLLVLMFVPQPQKAATEMRRVTRPGGTVAACTWDRNGLEMNAAFWEEAIRLDPGAEAKAERSRHYNRSGQLAELWRETGLQDVEESLLEIPTEFSSFDDYWQPYTSGVARPGLYVASLSPGSREALRNALRKRFLGDRPDGGFTLGAKAWAVRGTVPA